MYKGKILKGGSGVGKSVTLFSIVVSCRHNGWLVFYIPEASLILDKNKNEKQLNILYYDYILKHKKSSEKILKIAKTKVETEYSTLWDLIDTATLNNSIEVLN